MRLVRTFGRGAEAAEALIKSLEQRGAFNLERVEPVVREILAEVSKRGDDALREYAGRFDSLGTNEGLLVSREEMKAAWEGTSPKIQEAMRVAQANIRAFAEAQRPKEWMFSPADGECWVLRAGGTVSAAIDLAHDCDACAGSGGGADCGVLAEAGERDDGGGVAGGSDGVLPRGRRTGNCGDGIRDGDDCASR